MSNKIKLLLFFMRWQIAGFIIYPLSLWIMDNKIYAILFGNTWGCILFYFIDKWLLTKRIKL